MLYKFKIALIGGVASTKLTLEKLIQHELSPECVYGYEPDDASMVSGYASMKRICMEQGITYIPFSRINEHAEEIASRTFDIIFVVGLSQIVSEKIISYARLGCIGYHPTLLPKGRGRAAIAWMVLEEEYGASNLFLINHGAVDSGPIFQQVPFRIDRTDDAETLLEKILVSLSTALDAWLPALKRGEWNPVPQNELLATQYEKRTPDDGWIDWHQDAASIDRLIKASTRPHPGAYTFLDDRKFVVWKSSVENAMPIRGVVGRVLKISNDNRILVQTGSGLLWISDYSVENNFKVRVGMRFGYYHELEIYKLKQQLQTIQARLGI